MINRGIRLCPASQIGCEESLLTVCAACCSRFVIVSVAATFPRLLSNYPGVSCQDTACPYWDGNSRGQEKKRCYRDTRGKRMQVVTVFCELWLKYDAGNKCDCRLWAPTVGFLLYQYALCYLIWSGVKNIQCSHTILIPVRKLNQLLPFYKLTTYGFTKPYAACCRLFSQISLLSFHCQSRLGFFYDPNSDGCIPVWNELAGCERGSSFASYCCHLVSGRKSTGTIRGDMRKLVCWRRTSLI